LLLDDREAREKEPSMMIIGCDFHPSFQQIAYVDQETGEYEERRYDISVSIGCHRCRYTVAATRDRNMR